MESIYDTQLFGTELQATWLYKVEFDFSNGAVNTIDKLNYQNQKIILTPTSISLPQMEIVTRDVYFAGQKRSFPVFCNTSGDLSAEFILSKPTMLLLLGSLHGTGQSRPEQATRIYQITITLLEPVYGRPKYVYVIYNPTITSVEHSDSMSFESEDQLKLNATFHYDTWTGYAV